MLGISGVPPTCVVAMGRGVAMAVELKDADALMVEEPGTGSEGDSVPEPGTEREGEGEPDVAFPR